MKTTIEINGRKYDAITGKLLPDSFSVSGKNPTPPVNKPVNIIPAIDGINHRPVKAANTPDQRTGSSQNVKLSQRKTQKSSTLLRTVVKKPPVQQGFSDDIARLPKAINNIQNHIQPGSKASPVPTQRLEHAKQVARSLNISRFGTSAIQKPKLVGNLKVAMHPQTAPSAPPLPPAITSLATEEKLTKLQVFNHKIAQSHNHYATKLPKEKMLKRVARNLKVKPKVLAIGAAMLAVIVLGGFLAYQNIPSFAIRVAARSAGFNGRLPGNIPSGYAFKGPIIYSKGTISLNYESNSDNRKFSITQKPTSWSSESLLTNYLISSKLRYQTYRDKGLTVFVYSQGNATWVDKGVWYSIAGEGSLSSDQILSIASSL